MSVATITLAACYDALPRAASTIGKRIYDCEADEERKRQSRKAVVSIEFSFGRFCWDVLWSQTNTQETNDVYSRP